MPSKLAANGSMGGSSGESHDERSSVEAVARHRRDQAGRGDVSVLSDEGWPGGGCRGVQDHRNHDRSADDLIGFFDARSDKSWAVRD